MKKTHAFGFQPDRLINIQTLAELLGVSRRHIYRLVDAGKIPRPVKLGGVVRWNGTDIQRWIDAGCPSLPSKKERGHRT